MDYSNKIYSNILFFLFLLMLSACENLIYYPDQKIFTTPDKYGYEYEEISFKSIDKLILKGWLIKGKSIKNKSTILYFHGNAQNRSTHFRQLAWLLSHGFDLIIPDYRGYGGSQGSPNKKDIYHDSLIFIRDSLKIHQRLKNDQFILWGQSLGGNIALRAAYEFQDKISLLILDSTFLSYQEVATNVLKENIITYIFSPLGNVIVDDQYSGEEVVEKIKIPVMILHGKNDTVIPLKFGEQIFNRLNTHKTMILFDGANHLQAFSKEKYRHEFLMKINNFID